MSISCANESEDKRYEELKQKIESGLDEEQRIRSLVTENMKKDTFDLNLNKLMGEVDSMNLVSVKLFLKNYGYPKISKDGNKLCDGVFYILQHNDVETMERYIDQLKTRAFQGEASKKQYALMKDRILTERNLKQIYGTQSAPRKNAGGYVTNIYYIWPIQNVEIVDSLRKEMGFKDSVEEYAKKLNIEFNRDEQILARE